MKLYYSILAALACYGCAGQQHEAIPPSPQDYSGEVDYRQLSPTIQAESETREITTPQTNLKTSTEKHKVKSTPVKPKNIEPENPGNQTESNVAKIITPQTNLETDSEQQGVKRSSVSSNNPEPEHSGKIDSEILNSGNQSESKDIQITTPQTNLETDSEQQEAKSSSVISNNIEPEHPEKIDSEILNQSNQADPNVTQIIAPQINLETDAEKQVIEDTPIEFTLEKLPLSFGNTWFLDRNQDKISNTTRCLLSSLEKNFNDGYSDSTMSLQLSTNTLLIKTNSSIDLSYPDIGIYIDQNEQFPLEQLFGESSILIKQNTQKITTLLLDGEKITIKLGFWPTWPKTETRSIDFLLSDFAEAYQSFLACEKI